MYGCHRVDHFEKFIILLTVEDMRFNMPESLNTTRLCHKRLAARVWVLAPILAWTSVSVAMKAHATELEETQIEIIEIESPALQQEFLEHRQRRVELRRSLLSGEQLSENSAERRKLTQVERDALNRGLREAMKKAYDERAMLATQPE